MSELDRPTLLVADDDDDQRSLTAEGARILGHDVIEAGNGSEALELLVGPRPPRVAILDWEMPGLSGPDVCRELRSRSMQLQTYLILLTVRDALIDLQIGLASGADDYLTKPCEPAELDARVRTGLRVIADGERVAEVMAELVAANEMLAAFSRALAHDLRGTIATVAGYAYLLESDATMSNSSMAMVRNIRAASRRMRDMVEDVLVLETAVRRPERAMFDVRQVIDDAAADTPDVDVVVGAVPEMLVAHRSSVVRSFKNLFENAARYAKRPDSATVTVGVSGDEDVASWTFSIDDDGPGIPVDDREQVVKSFVRGANSADSPGTGLGLSIVAACARAHDGELTITDGPRGGACFRLRLSKPELSESN